MSYMFSATGAFDQGLSGWDVSKVTNMSGMFSGSSAFNRNLSNWNVGAVTDMRSMFNNAQAFNQSLAAWGAKFNTSVDLSNMLSNCGMNIANYDATLTGFNAGTLTGRSLGATNLLYCASVADRNNLINAKSWTISGDALSTACLPPAFMGGPNAVSVCAGLGASFAVTVSYGSTYTWQVDMGSGFVNLSEGGVYSGVNSTTLSISNVSGLNGYQYRCVASNTNGATNSSGATLTVNPLPTLTLTPPAAQC